MHKAILMILLVSVSSSAIAEWVEIAVSAKEAEEEATMTAYADPDTIRKTGDRIKLWVLADYKIINEKYGVASSRQKDEYDCKERKQRRLFIVFYSGHMNKGETVLIHKERGDWEEIPRGSLVEAMLEFACGLQPKSPLTFSHDTFL
jgi:hypothetical protein